MAGQPLFPGIWEFNVTNVQVFEAGGVAPSMIINSPNLFHLEATLDNKGVVSGVLTGAHGHLNYYARNVVSGATVQLGGGPVNFAKAAGIAEVVSSPNYGSSAGVNELGLGTWEILAYVTFDAPYTGIVSAFDRSLVVQVI